MSNSWSPWASPSTPRPEARLTVTPIAGSDGQYTLLDGHMRLLALQQLGVTQIPCLEALDDESYTYNNRLNRLSSIQEHYMIRRALDRGVPAERLARALNLDVSHIRKKVNLMDGICPEVAGLVEDRLFSPELFRLVRRMKPTRQVECVELMLSANNLTVSYAEALLAATPAEMPQISVLIRRTGRWRGWNAKCPTSRGNTAWSNRATGRMF